MKYQKLFHFLQNVGKNPSALILEDELTHLHNRRYLFGYFKNQIDWNNLGQSRVSLLLINIDNFKLIADQYGRHAGDQCLKQVSEILESAAEDHDVAVRYAGDEFILLLPNRDKRTAARIAGELVLKIRENLLFSPETGKQISVTASIGISTAPDDAKDGRFLIRQAETALHHARVSGGNRYADASTVSRRAIRNLDNAGIVGRKGQFERIGECLKKVGAGESQLVIVDGGPGMGKTSFLDAVGRNLEKNRLRPVRINGVVQEAFRPYYLISYAVIVLMNQRKDKGIPILEAMSGTDLSCLTCIMPQLAEDEPPDNFPGNKKAISSALGRFLAGLIGNRPLVLLIDDLHYADPASLDLIREMMVNRTSLMFICATAAVEKKKAIESIPLELFRTAYNDHLEISNIDLPPLASKDVEKLANLIFPGIFLPDGLPGEIAGITNGNPLFIISIMRKMIADKKIIQSKNRWTAANLEEGYFPRSFDEIIRQIIKSLDIDSKQFLDRASAFGESTSLSMLAGFPGQQSSRIYDFLKEAIDCGIVRSEYEQNDENIRFSSKQVRDVIYDGIAPDEKKQIHEAIGMYQEKLYHQNLIPSAAFLVYHFKRSDNREKARTYEELMHQFNQRIYDFHDDQRDASVKTAEPGEPEEIVNQPLSDTALKYVPHLVRALLIAVRNLRLYPPESKSVANATDQLAKIIRAVLQSDKRLSLIVEKNRLLVNASEPDTRSFSSAADRIIAFWNRLELKSLTFKKGVTQSELSTVLQKISHIDRTTITPGFWRRFSEENNLINIVPRQLKYTKMEGSGNPEKPVTSPEKEMSESDPPDKELVFGELELKSVRQIIATFLGACGKLKLYPPRGPVAQNAIYRLANELQSFLRHWPAMVIARVENGLLINGIKLDPSGSENVVHAMYRLLETTGLSSISFNNRVSATELAEFIYTAVRKSPGTMDSVFWQKFAAERQVVGIAFDQNVYGVLELRNGVQDTEIPNPAGQPSNAVLSEALEDGELENLPDRIRELYLRGNKKAVESTLGKLTGKYRNADFNGKIKIIEVFEKCLDPPGWRPPAGFIKIVLIPAIGMLEMEKETELAHRLFLLGHHCGETFILFGEYETSTWLYTRLRQTEAAGKIQNVIANPRKPHIFGRPLDSRIADAIVQDLKSDNQARQQGAYQLVSSLGIGMLPLLTDIIRQAESLRVRRLCAELIGLRGDIGVNIIKHALMDSSRPEERARILDVIDTVTIDVSAELAYVLSDAVDNVRRSAFRLAERINSPEIMHLLMEFARNGDSELRIFAISALGRLKPAGFAAMLDGLMEKHADPEVLIAVCRAMGQIGDTRFIEPLTRILAPGRRFLRRKKYDSSIRVAATYALAQIQDERATVILRGLKEDPDARIRQVVGRYRT